MRVNIEATPADLAEMGVTAEQLQETARNALSRLDVDGDALYINDLDVHVLVSAN